jgi:hypothetical protein
MSNDPQVTTCDLRVPSLRLEDRALDRHPDAAEGPPRMTRPWSFVGRDFSRLPFAIAPHAFSCLGKSRNVAIAHGILCSILAFGFGAIEALFVPC